MAHQDRRRAVRYPALVGGARVGWWEGKHFQTAEARIEDISTGGAAMTIGPEALTAPVVWVCLAGPSTNEWVQAQLTGVATAEDGAQLVRLAFPLSCPYELFKAVAWGEPVAPSPQTATAPEPERRAEAPVRLPVRPPARATPESPPGEKSAYVVVLSLPFGSPPTLCQAERSIRASKDRVGVLSWVVASAVGLAVAVLIAVLVFGKLEGLRSVESYLKASRP